GPVRSPRAGGRQRHARAARRHDGVLREDPRRRVRRGQAHVRGPLPAVRSPGAGVTGPEAALQTQVIQLGHLYRWRIAHFRPALTAQGWRTPVEADGAGFPDLVLTRSPELIIAELKSDV